MRIALDLPPTELDQLMHQYLVEFALLAPDQARWNDDCEPFVVANK